jgi:hypothetical protein
MLQKNSARESIYSLTLVRHGEAKEELMKAKNKINQGTEIELNRQYFVKTAEVLDLQNTYPTVIKERLRFATKKFFLKFCGYFLWLVIFSTGKITVCFNLKFHSCNYVINKEFCI